MSVILCKYGCLSYTDYEVGFEYDEKTGEWTCEPCVEGEADES